MTTIPEIIDGFYLRKVAVLEDQNAAFRADMVDSQHWKQEYMESLKRIAELEDALQAVEWFIIRSYQHCVFCFNSPDEGHDSECIVGNALRGTA